MGVFSVGSWCELAAMVVGQSQKERKIITRQFILEPLEQRLISILYRGVVFILGPVAPSNGAIGPRRP